VAKKGGGAFALDFDFALIDLTFGNLQLAGFPTGLGAPCKRVLSNVLTLGRCTLANT